MLAYRSFLAANVSAQLRFVCRIHHVHHVGGGNSWKYSSDTGSIHPKPPKNFKPTHIIVGAGSAGCVLANRLSENPDHLVLLLEAGPKDNWWDWRIHMPAALMYNLCHDKYNWFYHTLAQRHMDDRVFYWPRGRVWGGSSTLNAMVYVRGHPADFDRWEREGATGWSYKNCLPYFKKAQTHPLSTGADDPFRGHAGPLHVEQAGCANPLHEAFMAAGDQLGVGRTADMNGARQEGFGPMDMTIKNGIRWSTSRAYLRPALHRPNIYTSTGLTCTRVLFDGRRAIGVEVVPQVNSLVSDALDSFTRNKFYCEAAVILAGGAINSPQILMNSGVGPASHLKSLGIPLVQDMPGVGSNLQDHLEIYVQQACRKPITLYKHSSWRFPLNVMRVGLQWFYNQTGLGASSHLESGGFARTSAEKDYPDIQFHFLPSTVHDDGRKPATSHGFQCHVGPMRSSSRGTVRLQSVDPRRAPLMDPNYMSCEEDWVEFRRCVRLTREVFAQPAFDEFRGAELAPGADCQTDEQIDAFVRQLAASAYHPSCTCKMGLSTDNMAVVDPLTMGVHGFDNLKVVDASVMPSITNGNLNAPTIMIAERAADLIVGRPPLPAETPPIWMPPVDGPIPAYLASQTDGN